MMSSRMMMNTNAMPALANDVDFSFGAMPAQQPYIVGGFDAAGAMAVPSVERPLLQHHSNLYDSFDLSAAGGFPFQELGFLPPVSLPLAPTHTSMAMAAMPPSLLTSLPGVPTAAEMYHPFGGAGGAAAFLKREDGDGGALVDAGGGGGGTIGLNLGRRTYFSPADVLAVDRLLTRSARLGGGAGMGMGLGMGVLGLGLGAAHHHHHQPPRCQADGCKADLSAAKHYHRRHKVCEFHAKAAAVAAAGKQQRFCQQCSRFHVLAEFDEAKRSCRKRLTEHNRRRRKPAGAQGKEDPSPPPKRADTCVTTSCNSDHHKTGSTAAANKSAVISPNGSGVSCLDAMDNNNGVQPSSGAAAPTALSLAALPLHDDKDDDNDGGLDSMLTRQVRGRRRDDDDDEEHRRFMTSLVMQHQGQHEGSGGHGSHGGDGGGGGGNILSCSSVSADQQNGGCNGFFEVDFI